MSVQLSQQFRSKYGSAEERSPYRRENGLRVDGRDQYPGHFGLKPSARIAHHEVHQDREDERGDDHAEAPDKRRPPRPADPEGREPREACDDGKVAFPAGRRSDGRDQPRGDECESCQDCEGCGEDRPSRVGREFTRTSSDG